MNYQTVFEVTDKSFSWMCLIPLLVSAVLFFFAWYNRKYRHGLPGVKIGIIVLTIIGGITLFISIILIPTSLLNQLETKQKYTSGRYQLIEGKIVDFHPMPVEGHSNESFTLNGVYFEYSDFQPMYSFNNSASHGGPIRFEGQQVRIGFITDKGKNLILRVDVKK